MVSFLVGIPGLAALELCGWMEWGRRVAEGPRKKAQSAIGKRSPKNGCVIARAKGSKACPMTNSLTRSLWIHPIFTTQGNTNTDKMGFKFPCPVFGKQDPLQASDLL
jgi:hypothetical protein